MNATDTTTKTSTSSAPPPLPQRPSYDGLLSSIKDQSDGKGKLFHDFRIWAAQQSEKLNAEQLFHLLYDALCHDGPCTAKTFIDILLQDIRTMPVNIVEKASNSPVQLLCEIVRLTPECQTLSDLLPLLDLFGSILVLCDPKPTYHEQNRITVLFKSCATRLSQHDLCLCLWVFTRPSFVHMHSTDWTRTFLQSLKDIYIDQYNDHQQALLKSDLKQFGSLIRRYREPLLGYKQFRADAERCGYSLSRSWSLRMVFWRVLGVLEVCRGFSGKSGTRSDPLSLGKHAEF